MIDSITRHAAQAIWHGSMQDGASRCGILLSQEKCIVAGIALPSEQSVSCFLRQTKENTDPSSLICGWFYTILPAVEKIIKQNNALLSLPDALPLADCIQLHLDLNAAGLLKMAAYTLHDDHLSNINLTMAIH
ncbi:MAG: hypothetical protein Q9M22_04100 [Mariprofundaceae bacterium]|nr:hypothetical protein [Mariprofundaceae bacterium]